jgi:hypothetical protein
MNNRTETVSISGGDGLLKGGIEVVEIPGDYVSYTEIMFKISTPKTAKVSGEGRRERTTVKSMRRRRRTPCFE